MECFEVLEKSEIFDGLSDEETRQIDDISEMVDYQPGSIIYREDEEANKLYIVAQGMVTISIGVGMEKQLYVATVTEGEVVDWSALLPPYRHTAGAKCMGATRLVSIDGVKLRKICDSSAHMCTVLIKQIACIASGRLRNAWLQLVDVIQAQGTPVGARL